MACLSISLCSCGQRYIRPTSRINVLLKQLAASHSQPTLSKRLLATLSNKQEKIFIELIDIQTLRREPLPKLNSSEGQPITLSISADGKTLAVIRKRAEEYELLVYKIKSGKFKRIPIIPRGIPKEISLSGRGRILAVEINRNGKWDIDLIRLGQ